MGQTELTLHLISGMHCLCHNKTQRAPDTTFQVKLWLLKGACLCAEALNWGSGSARVCLCALHNYKGQQKLTLDCVYRLINRMHLCQMQHRNCSGKLSGQLLAAEWHCKVHVFCAEAKGHTGVDWHGALAAQGGASAQVRSQGPSSTSESISYWMNSMHC